MKSECKLMAAAAIAAGLLFPMAVEAETIGFAEAIDHLAVSCKSDIAKYCAKENLGGGRVAACLLRNGSATSLACRKTINEVANLVRARSSARAALPKLCERDRLRLCAGMVEGDGHLLECFDKVKSNVSAACRRAVEDSGYEVQLNPGPITDQVHLDAGDLLTSLEGVGSAPITAAKLRQLTAQSIHDPNRTSRVNRPPAYEQLSNLAQMTVAIQFDFNSARINPASYRALGLMADALYHPHLLGQCFMIVGHTDAVGSREYNVKLSQQRADAIREALVSPFGIGTTRLEAVGMGEEQLLEPANPNAAENRRVQLINVGKLAGNPECRP
jgi:OmpA-OmpF porin, OOP family